MYCTYSRSDRRGQAGVKTLRFILGIKSLHVRHLSTGRTTEGPSKTLVRRPWLLATCRNAADLVAADFNHTVVVKTRREEKTRRWCVCFVCFVCCKRRDWLSSSFSRSNRILVNATDQLSRLISVYITTLHRPIVTMKVIAALIVTASSVAAFSPASFGTRCMFLFHWIQ